MRDSGQQAPEARQVGDLRARHEHPDLKLPEKHLNPGQQGPWVAAVAAGQAEWNEKSDDSAERTRPKQYKPGTSSGEQQVEQAEQKVEWVRPME